jgi:hypothetical protein
MNLIMLLLLVIAALVAAVRIVDARRSFGVVMLGAAALLLLSVSALLLLSVSVVSHQRVTPATTQVVWETARAVSSAETQVSEIEDDSPAFVAYSATETAPEPLDESDPPSQPGEDASAEPRFIDIATGSGEVIIPPRPDWVEAEDQRIGDVHTTAVSSGPHETERECRKALDRELDRAVREYIDWHLGSAYGERFRASDFVRYDPDAIQRRLVPEGRIYHEVIRVSFGPMHQMHAQLAFDPAFREELDARRAELDRRWQDWVVTGRLLGIALGFGVLLAVMTVFFGYFRLDTATRGFYSGRLQWTAVAAILILMTVSAVLASRILQM